MIENSSQALLCEYYRLQSEYLALHWSVMRGHKIEIQLKNVESELWQRGTLIQGMKSRKHLCK